MTRILFFFAFILFCSYQAESFKETQRKYPRVREAFSAKESLMLDLLRENYIDRDRVEVYLRAFKSEKQVELWAKNLSDSEFKLLKTYDICQISGKPGPKRKRGDMQIPEGFYHIDKFNPYSNFYLSLGINYPNKSDRILGDRANPGGDIFIHGACVTIGCIPITDDRIKELYIFCIEARNNGQTKIPVTIFPSRLTDEEFDRISEEYSSYPDITGLWCDLKKGFDSFNETKQLPSITFLDTGRHSINQ